MRTCIRSMPVFVCLATLFLVFQTQVLSAQEAPVKGGVTATVASEPQISSSSSQVVPALPVPRLIKFGGVAKDASGQVLSGVVGITFSIYATQEGGTPLWTETQNLDLDVHGHYGALLGSSQSGGVPLDLFTTGEPRWLGAKLELPGEVEQPRILLVSVPYALKAADADTVGGMPASAFMLAPTASSSVVAAVASSNTPGGAKSEVKSGAKKEFSSTGTQYYVPVFTDNLGDIGNSTITQSPNGNVGIGDTNPVNARMVIVGNGGAILNASNDVDTDFYIDLTAPGASLPYTQFGPGAPSNLALAVGGVAYLWLTNTGNIGVDAYPGSTYSLDVEPNTAGTAGGLNVNNTNSANTVDGIDVYSANGYGIYSTTNSAYAVYDLAFNSGGILTGADFDGIDSFGGGVGGYFNGYSGGNSSVTDTDITDYAGAFGGEFGPTTENFGLYGYSASALGIGTYGQAIAASTEGSLYGGQGPWGVWGDTNTSSGYGSAILATGDDNYAVIAVNNSPSGWSTSWFENDETSANNDWILHTYGGGYGGECTIDVSGNLTCNGTISGVVGVEGGSKKVAVNSIQSPENWFEDAGSGQLASGEAVINIEAGFGQTVNTGVDYHVFLTPNGDCKGLYVAQKSATSFVVRELGGGTSSIAFDYRIMAKRKGFEQARLVDVTQEYNGKNRPRRASVAKHMPTAKEMRQRMAKHAHKPQPAKPRSVARIVPAPITHKR